MLGLSQNNDKNIIYKYDNYKQFLNNITIIVDYFEFLFSQSLVILVKKKVVCFTKFKQNANYNKIDYDASKIMYIMRNFM